MQTEIGEETIGRMALLGSGGQGKVYDVPDLTIPGVTGPFVYKQYREKVLNGHESAIRNGMGRLIAVRAAEPRLATFMDRMSIWPLAVVVPKPDSPGARGIIMRKLPATCFHPIQLPRGPKMVEFCTSQYFRTEEETLRIGLPAMTDDERWRFLLRAGMFIQKLHVRGVVIGDLSGNNVLIDYDPGRPGKAFVPMFIDTDGCRIRSQGAPFKQLNTPAWEPPEIRSALRVYDKKRRDPGTHSYDLAKAEAQCYHLSMATDVYKFGLLIQRFLHKGVSTPQDLPSTAGPSQVRVSYEANRVVTRICGPARAAVIRRAQQAKPKDRPDMTELLEAMLGQSVGRGSS